MKGFTDKCLVKNSPSSSAFGDPSSNQESNNHPESPSLDNTITTPTPASIPGSSSSARTRVDLSMLPSDPAERKPICQYHSNDRDEIRRAYLQKSPYQPCAHNFPQSDMGGVMRRFNPLWFDQDEYASWLEYSIKEDAAFCLWCYLFKNEPLAHGGGDVFSTKGFRGWNKKDRLDRHIGGPSNVHNKCCKMVDDLLKQDQAITSVIQKKTERDKHEYRTRLGASIDVARLLLSCGLPFRGHDESESSLRKGNFLTFLNWYAERVDNVGDVILKNAPKNSQMTCPSVQKDIISCCAKEVVQAIIKDIGDDYFVILVDESRDVSHKEQMALVLRYVDQRGIVMERLVGIVHVAETTALSLKEVVYSLLSTYSLSPCQIRGQGYDGASNMQGHLGGLRSLIAKDSRGARCIHCFAHQLQLTLVAVAKNHDDVEWLFELIAIVLNVIGASFKNRDLLRVKQSERIEEALRMGELTSGRGLNQERGVVRPGDTRWSSHYKSLVNVGILYGAIIDCLDSIATDGLKSGDRIKAQGLLDSLQSFEFVFMMHLKRKVLSVTNDLNIALQKKDQDILNAVSLLSTSKKRLQQIRDNEWDELIDDVTSFCVEHDISIPNMAAVHAIRGKSKRRVSKVTNEHYYRVDVMFTVVDMQLQELNSRFDEVNTDLILGVACLNPINSFADFDKSKLLKMARLYPDDFDDESIAELKDQLDCFIVNVRDDARFSDLRGLGDLSKMLVETKKHRVFSHVYLLLKLALILPVATATVERAFSAIKYIKSDLRNRMGDEFLNDSLIPYVEYDVFESVTNDAIIDRFQKMKSRRDQV